MWPHSCMSCLLKMRARAFFPSEVFPSNSNRWSISNPIPGSNYTHPQTQTVCIKYRLHTHTRRVTVCSRRGERGSHRWPACVWWQTCVCVRGIENPSLHLCHSCSYRLFSADPNLLYRLRMMLWKLIKTSHRHVRVWSKKNWCIGLVQPVLIRSHEVMDCFHLSDKWLGKFITTSKETERPCW